MVIRKHCIELDDANKFNAKFQCTTQSYLQLNIYYVLCEYILFLQFFLGGQRVCRFCPQNQLLNPPVLILLAVAV